MSKRFQRTIEDFTCEHCFAYVRGSGYTNHCTQCLWSKHVDVNPGDRQEECGGLMMPVSVSQKNGEHTLAHKCETCGIVRNNKTAKNDTMQEIINIMKSYVTKTH